MLDHLQQHGVSAKPTEKTKMLQGLLHLLKAVGDLTVLDYWRDPAWVRLFCSANLRKGQAYTVVEIRQIAQPRATTPAFMEQFAKLVEQQVFRRGFNLSCEICGLTHWYSFQEAAHIPLLCQGCRQPLSFPLEQPFAYQPNSLLCGALKNGIITEILVLLWAQRQWADFAFHANVELRAEDISAEIDLVLRLPDGSLHLVEAKDDFSASQPIEGLSAQMEAMGLLARELDAQLIFATLYEGDFPATVANFFTENSICQLRTDNLLA